MNDVDIIRLFLERNEKAIICTKTVYGKSVIDYICIENEKNNELIMLKYV